MFRLVGGKGGTGKTTCAAGLAVAAAARGRRTLVISTDPAPSLGDALGQRLTSTPRRIAGCARLDALEIDSHRSLERWLRRRRGTLEEIAIRGTWLDRADVRSLLDLALPGIDEIAALIELLAFTRAGTYDEVIVDTAPTGHTLRMLALPETLGQVASAFDHMQGKHRVMVEALRGGYVADDADALIQELRDDAATLRDLLRDPARAEVSIVCLPEPMAIEETLDAIRILRDSGTYTARIIVNRMTPPPPNRCGWCDGRRTHERVACEALLRLAGIGSRGPSVVAVAMREREPVGVRALGAIGRELERAVAPIAPARRSRRAGMVIADLPDRTKRRSRLRVPRARLLMFGGKGGVGKTTCAAAAALDVAMELAGEHVLLVSTDPAHSLADALGTPVSDRPAAIPNGPPNLEVRELDPAAALRAFKVQYARAIDSAFDRFTSSSRFDMAHDRQIMHDLIELSPPGLDEIAATLELTELLDGNGAPSRYATVVVDTAPTGHALRLLQMPGIVHDWVKALMGILLKYQTVTGLGDLGAGLLRLSRGLGRMRKLLQDPEATRFVVVTRAAALPRAESARLLGTLRKLGVCVPSVMVNAVGQGTCNRCKAAAVRERREIAALTKVVHRHSPRAGVVIAPATVPPPHGVPALGSWRDRWALHSARQSSR